VHDKRTCDGFDDEQSVFVTETIADTMLLRSFGVAAAPVSGFSRLNQRGIELLREHYGLAQDPSEREKEEELEDHAQQEEQAKPNTAAANAAADTPGPQAAKPNGAPADGPRLSAYVRIGDRPAETEESDTFRLTFVRWSPYTMSKTEPESIQRAINELKDLKRYRRLDIHEAEEWIPLDADLESLRFALARREPSWIKDSLLNGIFSGLGALGYEKISPVVISPPTDVAGAVAYLQEAMLGTADEKSRQRRKEALHNYHRVVARRITGPMLRQAEATTDPFDQALQLQFVQLNAMFMERAPTVREQLMLGLIPRRDESLKYGSDKSISELLAISGQLVSLAKEIKKWKPRSKPAPRAPTEPKTNHSRRFAASDFAMKN